MKKFLVSVVCVLSVWCCLAQPPQNPLITAKFISSPSAPGNRIDFYEYKPPHFSSAASLPLIISLHGGGEAGPDGGGSLHNVLTFGLPQLVDQGKNLEFTFQGVTEGFVMLAPQTNPGLVFDWPVYYVDEMIAYAVANLKVDPARVFLTGYSLGGKGVWRYATSSPAAASKLAGIVPAAAIGLSGVNFCNIAANKVATWVQHSKFDEYGGVTEAVNNTNAVNACPTLVVPAVDTIYHSGSHGIYMQKTYDFTTSSHVPSLFQWMLKVNRNLNPATNQNPVPVIAGQATVDLIAPVNIRNLPILDGSGSFDPDDIIMDYLWEQTTGPSLLPAPIFPRGNPSVPSQVDPVDLDNDRRRQFPVVTIPLPASAIGVPVGTYTFRLRVQDYLTSKPGHTQFATKVINVALPANQTHAGPATDAGEDKILGPNETFVARSGTAQAIYGGTIAGYNWTFVSGPKTPSLKTFNGSADYQSGDNNVGFTGMDLPGNYVFRFTATNNFGDPGFDEVTFTRQGLLPVTYAYVNGKNTGNKNTISWATTNETNSDRFEIMRSADGINFSKLGTVQSKGGATLTEYTFDDSNAPAGTSYYRLSQVDKDGHVSLSKVVAVNNRKTSIYVEKYPNPVHDNLTVTIQGNTNGSLQAVVADMQGKTILQQGWQKDQPTLRKLVNVAGLQNGVYQLIITIGQEKQVSSFVKY
jgi:poly(3-hydroxybutyrate) depolymerase